MDLILTNVPFGGEEDRGILSNFPKDRQTAETALLFLQLIMRRLKRPGPGNDRGGRAGVIVPNGTLFGDGVCARVKEDLLKHYHVHTIVRLPEGVFAPYTDIPSNLIFFDRSGPTQAIWYYQVPLPAGRRKYTKTKPMEDADLTACLAWWDDRTEGANAWRVNVADVLKYDAEGRLLSVNLDIKNPHGLEALEHREPLEIVADIINKEQRLLAVVSEISDFLRTTR